MHTLFSCVILTAFCLSLKAGNISYEFKTPEIMDVNESQLCRPEFICRPKIRTFLGYTRRVLHLHDGKTLAVMTYSNTGTGSWLFLINSETLDYKRYDIPNADRASHGAALGCDGNIYIMPYLTNRAYKFDVQRGTFSQIHVDVPAGEYTWDAFGASNGKIYFGTYPNACLGEYDIETGALHLIKHVTENAAYVTQLEQVANTIRFLAWGPGKKWMTYDAMHKTISETACDPHDRLEAQYRKEVEENLPLFWWARSKERIACESEITAHAGFKLPEQDSYFRNHPLAASTIADGRTYAVTFPSSRLWEINNGSLRLLADPKAPAETWYLEQSGRAIIGISHYGLVFRYDVDSHSAAARQIDNWSEGGTNLMFIERVGVESIIGANYSQQNLFSLNPVNGQVTHARSMVAGTLGEAMCAVGLKNKAYVGFYTDAILSVYDPTQAFEFSRNPRQLIELRTDYDQIRPRAAATNGQLIFMTTDSAYNLLGGALAVINPETEHVDVYHHLIKDENLPTLAYDPVTGYIWGGTDIWGQMRSHPPTQNSSRIYAFDPGARKIVLAISPWFGADQTDVLGISHNGILVASANSEIALIETRSGKTLYKGPHPFKGRIPRDIKRGSDGYSYCVADHKMYQWDLKRNVIKPVAALENGLYLTEYEDNIWFLADAASIYRVDLSKAD